MTPDQISLVRQSFARVVPIADTAAELFYDTLFAMRPRLRAMFPQDLTAQKKKLVSALAMGVGALDRPEKLTPVLYELGARHVAYGVQDCDYDTVGEALLETLSIGLGPGWTEETKAAWVAAYTALSGAMRRGAAQMTAIAAE